MRTHTRKRAINIKAAVDAWLIAHGATPSASIRMFRIDTILGPLYITAYDDWIACCFDNVQAAKTHYGVTTLGSRLNPYSGKWNWHYFGTDDWSDFTAAMAEILP